MTFDGDIVELDYHQDVRTFVAGQYSYVEEDIDNFIKIASEESLLYRWEMNDINTCKSLLKVPGYGTIRTDVLLGSR
jgi:hypothetical protein